MARRRGALRLGKAKIVAMRWVKSSTRWAFVIVADLSLLLCVCSVVFWVRSYWAVDVVHWEHGSRRPLPEAGSGIVEIDAREIIIGSGETDLQMSVGHFVFAASTGNDTIENVPGLSFMEFRHEWPPYAYASLRKMTTVFDRLGLRIDYSKQLPNAFRSSHEMLGVAARHWMLVVLFGLLPAMRGTLALRRKHRIAGDLCRGCGYDMRATKERCPECGLVVESAAKG
jgi:hypothetical protein